MPAPATAEEPPQESQGPVRGAAPSAAPHGVCVRARGLGGPRSQPLCRIFRTALACRGTLGLCKTVPVTAGQPERRDQTQEASLHSRECHRNDLAGRELLGSSHLREMKVMVLPPRAALFSEPMVTDHLNKSDKIGQWTMFQANAPHSSAVSCRQWPTLSALISSLRKWR